MGLSCSILSFSQSLSQIQALTSSKSAMQGSAGILEQNIKEDEAGSGHTEVGERKQLSNLNDRISNAEEQVGQKMADLSKKIEDNSKTDNNNRNDGTGLSGDGGETSASGDSNSAQAADVDSSGQADMSTGPYTQDGRQSIPLSIGSNLNTVV